MDTLNKFRILPETLTTGSLKTIKADSKIPLTIYEATSHLLLVIT